MIQVEHLKKNFRIQQRAQGAAAFWKDMTHRQYQTLTAVNDISFSIAEGEMVGYIGPNGSGKSTTIKMLCGILNPTEGRILVNGLEPYNNRKENSKQIGVVFGQRTQLWWDIPVRESLNLLQYIYKVPCHEFHKSMDDFTEILGLDQFIDTPVRQLSLGQRMRADLCASLLHSPKILYLDEPTIGLDIVVKQKIRTFIKEINERRKTTVILTTHDISDIEQLCSRVIVIEKGSIKYQGSLEELKALYGQVETIQLQLDREPTDLAFLKKLELVEIKCQGQSLSLTYDLNRFHSLQLLQELSKVYRVLDFKVIGTEIEDVISRIYQQD